MERTAALAATPQSNEGQSNSTSKMKYKSENCIVESFTVTPTANNTVSSHTRATYGIDSPAGAIMSFPFTPIYLYATLKGKFDFWDRVLTALPDAAWAGPTLDAGCGSGIVLIKTAQQVVRRGIKNKAYGIDIFDSRDQTGNSPERTLRNIRAEGVGDAVVLHRGSFTDLPYADESFTLGEMAALRPVHNPSSTGDRAAGIRELWRVLKPGGHFLILDLAGARTTGLYLTTLRELGMTQVEKQYAGTGVMFGLWYCNLVQGIK